MPRINQQLMDRLQAKLEVGIGRVYAMIADKATEMLLDRHLAALVVASENYLWYMGGMTSCVDRCSIFFVPSGLNRLSGRK
jgi:hypothetical protein